MILCLLFVINAKYNNFIAQTKSIAYYSVNNYKLIANVLIFYGKKY